MNIFLGGEVAFKASEPFGKLLREMNGKLSKFINADSSDNTYGSEFQNIGIITMILGEGLETTSERILVKHKKKDADIRLKIDYTRFVTADEKIKELLYVKNIIDSIMIVEERKKGDFNGLKLIDDILETLDLTKEQINI